MQYTHEEIEKMNETAKIHHAIMTMDKERREEEVRSQLHGYKVIRSIQYLVMQGTIMTLMLGASVGVVTLMVMAVKFVRSMVFGG